MSSSSTILKQRALEAGGEVVFLVLDCNAEAWEKARVLPSDVILAVSVFRQAVWTFHANNQLSILLSANKKSIILSDRPLTVNDVFHADAGPIELGIDFALLQAYKRKRVHKSVTPIRIVVVTASPISNFIVGMNSAFAAQKLDIVVDVVDAWPCHNPTAELVQITQLTSGVYFKPRQDLLDHLYFLVPDAHTRSSMSAIQRPAIDLRAECFCHRTPVSIGYVCSVCLAVYCQIPTNCPSCNVKVR